MLSQTATAPSRVDALLALDDAIVNFRRFWARPAPKERFVAELGEPVSPRQYSVVRAVAQAETAEPCVSDVATQLNIDASTASRFVADVVRAGYLARHQSGEDRRRSVLRLTPRGQGLLARGAAIRQRILESATSGWPSRDVEMLGRLLDRLSRGVDAIAP
jgi:DNA-binding MarR family transcriptional regulator